MSSTSTSTPAPAPLPPPLDHAIAEGAQGSSLQTFGGGFLIKSYNFVVGTVQTVTSVVTIPIDYSIDFLKDRSLFPRAQGELLPSKRKELEQSVNRLAYVTGLDCVVFSTKACPYCVYAKEFLDKMGKKDQYAVVELDDPENRYMGAALSASLNVSTVPVILMKKHFIGGYTDLLHANEQCKQDLRLDPRDRKMAGYPVCNYLYGHEYNGGAGAGEDGKDEDGEGVGGGRPALAGG